MFDISPGKHIKSEDGTKIWAQAAGDPSKPAVVFIHGFAFTGLIFEKQFTDAKLLKNLHLVRYDIRGHGRSDMPQTAEAYASLRHAQDFRAVCEGFNVTKPFVAGWSVGGIFPVDIAAAYGASYMAGIIYIAALPWRSVQPEVGTAFNMSLLPRLCSQETNQFREGVLDFMASCSSDPASVPFGELASWIGSMTMQPNSVRLFFAHRTQDQTRFLKEASKTLPILVIQGTEDKHLKCAESIANFRKTFSDLEVHKLEGVGHLPFYEKPEEFKEMVLNFVKKVVSQRGV